MAWPAWRVHAGTHGGLRNVRQQHPGAKRESPAGCRPAGRGSRQSAARQFRASVRFQHRRRRRDALRSSGGVDRCRPRRSEGPEGSNREGSRRARRQGARAASGACNGRPRSEGTGTDGCTRGSDAGRFFNRRAVTRAGIFRAPPSAGCFGANSAASGRAGARCSGGCADACAHARTRGSGRCADATGRSQQGLRAATGLGAAGPDCGTRRRAGRATCAGHHNCYATPGNRRHGGGRATGSRCRRGSARAPSRSQQGLCPTAGLDTARAGRGAGRRVGCGTGGTADLRDTSPGSCSSTGAGTGTGTCRHGGGRATGPGLRCRRGSARAPNRSQQGLCAAARLGTARADHGTGRRVGYRSCRITDRRGSSTAACRHGGSRAIDPAPRCGRGSARASDRSQQSLRSAAGLDATGSGAGHCRGAATRRGSSGPDAGACRIVSTTSRAGHDGGRGSRTPTGTRAAAGRDAADTPGRSEQSVRAAARLGSPEPDPRRNAGTCRRRATACG